MKWFARFASATMICLSVCLSAAAFTLPAGAEEVGAATPAPEQQQGSLYWRGDVDGTVDLHIRHRSRRQGRPQPAVRALPFRRSSAQARRRRADHEDGRARHDRVDPAAGERKQLHCCRTRNGSRPKPGGVPIHPGLVNRLPRGQADAAAPAAMERRLGPAASSDDAGNLGRDRRQFRCQPVHLDHPFLGRFQSGSRC
jgi:hypothetical protein